MTPSTHGPIGRVAVPGRVALKLGDSTLADRLPHYLDVRRGSAAAALRVDGSAVDRVLRAHSPATLATRAFGAAAGEKRGRQNWDDLEHDVGLSRTVRVAVDPAVDVTALCADLRALACVESAAPVLLSEVPPPAPSTDGGYAFRLVRGSEALAFEPGDRTLVVAVIDSGVDLEHEELSGRLRPGVDTVDLPRGEFAVGLSLIGDYEDPDSFPRDEMGHGTACASILGARGVAMCPGLAGAAWVLPVRALAAARRGLRGTLTAVGATSDIDHALKTAVDLGARVLNLSFGTSSASLVAGDAIPHEDVIAYARARHAILVAASGNDGTVCEYYPAALAGVIAVGSVDSNNRPSRFSTRGDHVALCAPGERVRAATLDGYGLHTGTSFAAPFVTAACALLWARAARYGVPISTDDVRDALVTTARPFAQGSDTAGSGAGVLDTRAALEALERTLTTSPQFSRAGSFRSLSHTAARSIGSRAEPQCPAPPTR